MRNAAVTRLRLGLTIPCRGMLASARTKFLCLEVYGAMRWCAKLRPGQAMVIFPNFPIVEKPHYAAKNNWRGSIDADTRGQTMSL